MILQSFTAFYKTQIEDFFIEARELLNLCEIPVKVYA